jgi:MFS family permease
MSWKVYRSGQRGRSGLWNNPSFLNLWAAETVSQFGAQITLIALPLAAALSLDASASQMGILTAAGTLPFLVFGLFAGVWVDRLRRKPILIATDVGRAAILLAVPLAWSFDLLRVEMLYLVAFIAGLQTLFFDVAYLSFLPAIVRRDDLVDGNSKLQGSASVAQVAGPGIAGLLVGLITAPLAIVANVLTYLVSAFFIARITIDEPVSERHARPHVLREVGEGLRAVFGNAALRAIATSGGLVAIFGYLFLAVYVLYMTEELGFSAGQVGLVFSLGGVGAIIGSLLATPLQRRLGIGPTIVAGRFLFGAFGLLVPLAVGFPAIEVPMVLAA